MSVRLRDVVMGQLDALRHEPTEKRIRATPRWADRRRQHARAAVWEPKRVVPTYAVPLEDVAAQVVTAAPTEMARPGRCAGEGSVTPRGAAGVRPQRPVLGPHHRRRGHDGPRVRLRSVGGRVPSRRPRPRGLRAPRLRRPSTPGTRRTSATSPIPATRSTASTSCTAPGTCGSSSTVHAARRERRADAAVRAAAPGPLLPRGRRRAHRPARHRATPHVLRLQGGGVVLVGGGRAAPRVVLPAPAPRDGPRSSTGSRSSTNAST